MTLHHGALNLVRNSNPIFKVLDSPKKNGVDQLDPLLTINGITVAPILRYKGGDADSTELLAWTYGEDLPAGGSGGSFNQGSPCLGTNDDSFIGETNRYYQADNDKLGTLGSDDFVIEMVIKFTDTNVLRYFDKKDSANVGYRCFSLTSGSRIRLDIVDVNSNNATLNTAAITNNAWCHVMFFVNRDVASSAGGRVYVNGVVSGASNMSAASGSLNEAVNFTVAANTVGGNISDTNIAYLAIWRYPDWHPAVGANEWDPMAAERFAKLTGVYAQKIPSGGDPVPETMTRASSAYLSKLESSITKLYLVEDNWPRVSQRLDNNGDQISGVVIEDSTENLLLQSEDFNTTWAKVGAGDSIDLNAAFAPNKELTADGIIDDGANTEHGVNQAITLTANPYCLQVFAKKSAQDWLYLSDDTVSNADCYFDLNNGVLGTAGSGTIDAGIESFGNGWYLCWITFTGTAASHTLAIQPAEADEDNVFAGDAINSTVYIWGAQCHQARHPRTYVPTTTTAVTKSADVLEYDVGTNILPDGEGTISCKVLRSDFAENSGARALTVSDNSANNYIALGINNSDQPATSIVESGGGTDSSTDTTSDVSDHIIHELKSIFYENSLKVLMDNTQGTEDTSVTVPTSTDQLTVGGFWDASTPFNGIISDIAIFKDALRQ